MLIVATFALASIVIGHGPAAAIDVGQPAPDFKLPGTMGVDVALADFRGKKWVLLEFYGADFVPT
jgi:peroxiredoxin